MKRFFKFGVLALVLVLVSGCGSKGKELTCTRTEDQDGMKSSMTIKASFDGDKATKIAMSAKMTVDESMAEYLGTLKTVFDAQYGAYAKKDGVKYSSEVKGSTINYSLEVDRTKVSEEDLKALELDGADSTYDDAKASMEKDGWTCK